MDVDDIYLKFERSGPSMKYVITEAGDSSCKLFIVVIAPNLTKASFPTENIQAVKKCPSTHHYTALHSTNKAATGLRTPALSSVVSQLKY